MHKTSEPIKLVVRGWLVCKGCLPNNRYGALRGVPVLNLQILPLLNNALSKIDRYFFFFFNSSHRKRRFGNLQVLIFQFCIFVGMKTFVPNLGPVWLIDRSANKDIICFKIYLANNFESRKEEKFSSIRFS